MAEPVVSYRYGKRPIIDVPAMSVHSGIHKTVPSLQQTSGFAQPAPPPQTVEVIVDPPVFQRPYHSAPAPIPAPAPFHYNHYDPNTYAKSNYYYGPAGEIVKPIEQYFDTRLRYPGLVYPPPAPLPPPPPAQHIYPLPPPAPHQHYRPPNYTRSIPQVFDVNCDLEFGRIIRISVRESRGHFRGIPDYLRRELAKSYGKYPSLQVKIKFQDGDFHIFANHDTRRKGRRERYEDAEDGYDDDSDGRDSLDRRSEVHRPRTMNHAPLTYRDDHRRDRGWDSYR